jgi:hypothetical protein
VVAVAADLGVHLKNSPGRRRSGDQKQSRHQRFRDRSRSPDYWTVRGNRDRDSEDEQDLRSRKMKSAGHERARESANEGERPRNSDASRSMKASELDDMDVQKQRESWTCIRPSVHALNQEQLVSALTPSFSPKNGVGEKTKLPAARGFQFSSTSPLLPTSRPFMGADVGTIAPFAGGPAGPHPAVSPIASPVGRPHRDGEQQHLPTFPLSKPLPLGWNALADAGPETKPLSTPFLSDSGVQRRPPARGECRSWWEDREGEQANWSPDKFQTEQLKQQQYAPHSSPPRSAPHSSPPHGSSAASWANAANVPNQAPYPPQRFGGVLSSPALPQQDSMHASTSGAPSQAQGSGAYPSGSQQQEHLLQHQHRDNAGLPPKTT